MLLSEFLLNGDSIVRQAFMPNQAPVGAVEFTGAIMQGQLLTAANTLTDGNGLGAIGYQWQVSANGAGGWADISGASTSGFVLTQNEVGKFVRVIASYTDGNGTSESVASASSPAVVTNINDAPGGTVTFSGAAAQDQILTVANTLSDHDGMGAVTYVWQTSNDGLGGWADIAGANTGNWLLTQAQVGKLCVRSPVTWMGEARRNMWLQSPADRSPTLTTSPLDLSP